MAKKDLKVAIVCDWLLGIGGAERVVLELHKMYPNAPIYTSQYDPSKIDWFKDADVRTTWLQKLPGGLKKFLPMLRALAFSRLDLSEYDLVISSCGAEAKGVRTGPNTKHICYCHSPIHYYWIRYDEYLAHPGFGKFDWLARIGLRLLVGPLRRWDFRSAQHPDLMVTNSNHTANMIEKYYGRSATVIFPPVDIDRFKPGKTEPKRHGFVAAGRQTPYKRIDLAVAACTKLNLPLTVIGDGPDHDKLVQMAGPSVTFVTANDQEIGEYFRNAEALIFPNLDDFGITAVEALAAGTPAIAFHGGGPLDYVIPGKTGLFFDEQTPESLAKALKNFKSNQFNHAEIAKFAEQFSTEKFSQRMQTFIDNSMQ